MGIDLFGGIMFVLGAIVGSFLNVCIVRLPNEQSVVTPRSHCVKCKKTIPWYDNIPLASYFILRGKCRYCGAKFSSRYFLVELITALAFLGFYLYFGPSILLAPYLFMMGCFIIATFVDFEHRIIPDEVSVGGMFAGLVFSLLIPELHDVAVLGRAKILVHVHSLGISMLGVLVGGGSIYLMGLLGDLIFKKESMGGGDVKLLAMIGAFLGWPMAILTIFAASVFGAVYGIIEKIRTKDSTIAFGPFLALGAIVCVFWGDAIIAWFLKGYGIY